LFYPSFTPFLLILFFSLSCSESNPIYNRNDCDTPIFGDWHSINFFYNAKINSNSLSINSNTCDSNFHIDCPIYNPIWPVVGTITVKDLSTVSSSCFQSSVKFCNYKVINSNQFVINCENSEIEFFRD